MATHEDKVQSYSELASDYDETRFSNSSGQFLTNTDKRIIRSFVGRSGAKTLLDVPVGTGRVLTYLSDQEIKIIGVDATEEMLSEASKVADKSRHTLTQGNAAELPFDDGEFDCLTSLRFFHLFKKNQRLVFAEEFERVVRPGGHLIVSFTNGWYGGGINWLKKLLGGKTVEFEHRGEIKKLFPNCRVQACSGNFLPKQWFFSYIPVLGQALQFLTSVPPFNKICWERIYLLQKLEDNE